MKTPPVIHRYLVDTFAGIVFTLALVASAGTVGREVIPLSSETLKTLWFSSALGSMGLIISTYKSHTKIH